MLMIANSDKYRDLSPHQIVPNLADNGEYIASESSFYRLLRTEKLLSHRSKSMPRTNQPPRTLVANKSNQVWSWDITYLPGGIKGKYYYLYMVEDVFSRYIVGWCVKEKECSDFASILINKCCLDQAVERHQVSLHADNGPPMKGATLRATLDRLGIEPSFSRPRVSNDNPYSESLFKTLKYCPQYPARAFVTMELAQEWVERFSEWYNTEHLHSEIRFVTPHARHYGLENNILFERDILYKISRNINPSRWSGATRNWTPAPEVVLNPGKKEKRQKKAIKSQQN
jgi:putative transposase